MKIKEAIAKTIEILEDTTTRRTALDKDRVEAGSVLLRAIKLRCGLTKSQLEEEI